MKRIKRKKAFIGAIIGAVGSIAGLAGNLISQKKQAKYQAEQQAADQAFAAEQAELDRQAEREQFEAEQNYLKEQRRLEQEAADKQWQQAQTEAYRQGALQNAMMETANLQNQEYVDVMKSRVMRAGGQFKDRNDKKRTKSKKKAGLGAQWNSMSSLQKATDIAGGVGGAIGGIGNLVLSLTQKTPEVVKQTAVKPQVFQREALPPVEQKQIEQADTIQAVKKKVIKQANPQQAVTTQPIARMGTKTIKVKTLNRYK